MPRIDSKLNLVFPVDSDAGTVWVHSTPVSREIFERYFHVISQAYTRIYAEGLQIIGGPRVAYLMLKEVAEARGEWEGPDGVENGLIAEFRRLTNVIVPGDGGWRTIPYHNAVRDGVLDAEDVAEVEGIIAFFISASAMHLRGQRAAILNGMCSLWGGQTTLLNSTAYAASLPISTVTDSSGEMEITSSVPS